MMRLQNAADATPFRSASPAAFCCRLTLPPATSEVIVLLAERGHVDFQIWGTRMINLLICYSGYFQQSCSVMAKMLEAKPKTQYSNLIIRHLCVQTGACSPPPTPAPCPTVSKHGSCLIDMWCGSCYTLTLTSLSQRQTYGLEVLREACSHLEA